MNTKLMVKIHKTREGKMLAAICDENLAGKVFEEGKKQLDLKSEFFKGTVMSVEQAKEILYGCNYAHFIGEHSVKLGIETEAIEPGSVLKVKNIPHAQMCWF